MRLSTTCVQWISCALVCGGTMLCELSGAEAAPVTLTSETRLTRVCEFPIPLDLADCAPDNSLVHYTLTYDPDTLVFDDSSPFRTLVTSTSVAYTISITPLDDPWGGTIVREVSEAVADFALDPFDDSAASVKVLDADNVPGCTAEGVCDRWWITTFEFTNHFRINPIADPTAADFAEMLKHPAGPGSVFDFQTVAFYARAGEVERTYLPGSRLYYSDRVPEPAALSLLGVGLASALLRRRGRR